MLLQVLYTIAALTYEWAFGFIFLEDFEGYHPRDFGENIGNN